MLLLQARVNLGMMAMKGFPAFPKVPSLLEPIHQRTLIAGSLTPLQRCSRYMLPLLPTGPSVMTMKEYSTLPSFRTGCSPKMQFRVIHRTPFLGGEDIILLKTI